MKTLLHTCCGPCATVFLDGWLADGEVAPCLLWHNPNIHPFTEYRARKNAAQDFAAHHTLDVIVDDNYGLYEFLDTTYLGADNARPNSAAKRCKICYEMRMNFTAAKATELNFTAFSTTLLASPWQNHEEIITAGQNAAKNHGVEFVIKDYREGFRDGKQKARQMGLYMQKYCGCIFSEAERYQKHLQNSP